MRLFDTLSQQTKELEFNNDVATMYVCGITPYDTSHIGHARVGIVYDTVRRYLEWRGLTVKYVQNITDIDDPLFERARRDGIGWRELGDRQTERYVAALASINVRKPEFYIKATDEIDNMLPVIARLIELGHAYVADGAVYYSVASKPDFGEIFHRDHATMLATANERGNDPNDPRKHDPLDFVLWQKSQPDEPAWDSPWGPGRPGWHIECSTIATQYLGPQIDIHGGGTDLIFPHHAAEIAQAEPVTGVAPFVRNWMHVGMVYLGGEKMSKSLGNMVFVADVLREYSPNALRLATLSKPYGAPYEYAEEDVQVAQAQAEAMTEALKASGNSAKSSREIDGEAHRARFAAALADNFDTPSAIITLNDLAEAITLGASVGRSVRAGQKVLGELAAVLGLQV